MIPAILSLAAVAAAVPVARQSGPTDVQILNYALTLEHLENNFYKAGLANFSAADFAAAGALPNFYANLQEIASDEQTHVDFLSGALKTAAVAPCSYAFPVTDAKSFLAVSQILEGVGVSAYLGAAQFIANKDYLTAAGAILTVEARHSSYIRANLASSPFPSAFDIPLDFDEVYSLAAQFITGCPSTNAPLPVKAFPALAASPGTPAKVGDKITLTAAKSVDAVAAYFVTILGPVSAPLSGSGTTYTITVPEGVQMGQEYVVLTSAAATPSDDNIVAGPAVIAIADNIQSGATGTSPAPMPSGSATPAGYGTYGSYGSYPSAPAGYGNYGSYGSYPAAKPAASGAPVSQIGDGQVQANPVQQIGDGQVQSNPVQQIGDGQVQANPVQQIGDGQVQSNPVQQIGDGQVQSNPVQQIGDGQVQSKPVQQIGDGQIQSTPPKN